MANYLSLISINIEGRKHLDLVIPFIKKHAPEVLLIQEICRQDMSLFEEATGAKGHFAPMAFMEKWNDEQGVAIFTKLPHTHKATQYAGHEGPVSTYNSSSREAGYLTSSFWLISADIEKGGKTYTIGTTHFPVTEGGEATWYQREALQGLFEALSYPDQIVFGGDLNAPRGKEIFNTIAARYKDNVPIKYTTSIDGNIHRAGPIPFVVDGLFSTDKYEVNDFEYVSGVSDHLAITAKISVIE